MNNEKKRRSKGFWCLIVFIILVPLISMFQLSCSGNEDIKYPDIFTAIKYRNLQAVKDFVSKNPALVNAKNIDGGTPLHYAAINGHREVAELLISRGVDVNAKPNIGGTPLHEAAINGQREVAEFLISKGANVNALENDGGTPLSLAKTEEIRALLRKRGAKE